MIEQSGKVVLTPQISPNQEVVIIRQVLGLHRSSTHFRISPEIERSMTTLSTLNIGTLITFLNIVERLKTLIFTVSLSNVDT